MLLTPKELEALTNRKTKSAQRRELNAMGIEYKIRSDESLVVSKAHVEYVLSVRDHKSKFRAAEPNWCAIRV